MYSKTGWIVAVALAIFPFATVVAKLAQTESVVTTLVVAAICAIFFLVVLLASRVTVQSRPETASPTIKDPAPPVDWSWDGVNRQPDADEPSKRDTGIKL